MNTVSTSLNALKIKQKKLSRKIGHAKNNGENFENFLVEIQKISEEIRRIESQLKNESSNDQTESSCDTTKKPPVSDDPTAQFALPYLREKESSLESSENDTVIHTFDALTEDHAAIETYLDKHPGSTPYHRPCILRTIQTTFLHDCCYWVAEKNSQIYGVLPVVQLNSKLFGNYCVSMPFFNFGGVLADNTTIAQKLLNHASSWAQSRSAQYVEYRYSSPTSIGLPSKSDKVSFYLSLPETPEKLSRLFRSKLRSQIKKAQSYTHHVRHGGAELIDDFYRVFSENMRDLGTPVYGKCFFQNLALTLKDKLNVTVIYYNKTPAAAAILIGHKKRLEIPWASTRRKYNPRSVNMLLYWEVLKWAIHNQYTTFDFGRCSPNSGTYKFKAQWGATEIPLYWDYHLFNGEIPQLNTQNKKYALLISIWKRLPVSIANLIGPHVVKYLP